MRFYYEVVFLFSPFVLLDVWVEVVVPSEEELAGYHNLPFPTLFADAAGERSGDLTPVLGTIFIDHLDEDLVFFFGPRPFDHCGIQHFLPSV